jgi:cytochrome oxidase Cu insertion factor (SCO1/SenC/PrrC family)
VPIHVHNGIGVTSTQQNKKENDMKKIGLILVVFAFLINGASAEQSLGVGDSAPDFSVVDASGKEIKLGDFKGKKNVVLVFYARHK